jgi:asparagine synthase (glutamine-hydrolysing)
MVGAVAHRGPDGEGMLRLPGCYLGHRRLSIIDLETGSQPMQDAAGRYTITFNGEIYNYKELRRELLTLGHRFRTTSDTEVVLAAFASWGAAFLDRVRGQFAFAIWDATARTLFAARDLFGEKPLYYAVTPDGVLVLGSKIQALRASGLLRPRLDLSAVEAYLALGYVPPDRTIYENVQTVPPGHYLEWDGTVARTRRYWQPRLESRAISLEEAAERLEVLVHQAVRRQMVADVPVGAFLSGGLDSSTIVAMMQAETPLPVKTFSVGFEKYVDELPFARAVAELYKTEHHELNLGDLPVTELLQTMARVYDEPLRDSSAIPTYLVSQHARQHVKVVLSGDGGDELFGGYAWYPLLARPDEVSRSWFQWMALRAASRLVRHRVPALARRAGAVGAARRWPEMVSRYMEYVIDGNSERRRLLWGSRRRHVPRFRPGEYYLPPDDTDGIDRAFYFDMTSFLPGDILVKVDRAAMAHGLETRPPFLDRDLVEFVTTLPAALKVRGEQTKIAFKHAFGRYWPESVRTRSKQGFGAPYQIWLDRPDVRELCAGVFARGSRLRDLLPGFDGVDHGMSRNRRWGLLMLGLWLEEHCVSP